MQEVAAREFSETAGKLSEDFEIRFKVKETAPEEEEEEFSFSKAFGVRSPVVADDAFEDGWIRPVFPLFNRKLLLSGEEEGPRSPVKNIFVAEEEGLYCEWDGKKAVISAAEAGCKKSNSTGFSKLWKLRETTMRSNSDGKDAFVFLSAKPEVNNVNKAETTKEEKKTKMKKKKSAEVKTTPFSAHYARIRAEKEGSKRASYLPYRVGFFANVSGMSRNVHPF